MSSDDLQHSAAERLFAGQHKFLCPTLPTFYLHPMRYLLPLLALAALSPAAALAQSSCYQVAAWTSPDLMRCQQVGQTQLGIPIWLCC